ncbi:MAG: phosphotransferase [Chloroflexota bacterium]|nr:phosphotransferase [Chloroflexota bacterium]MDE2941777.1 phosphotransferase [Chloroflexota bacterium]MDE3266841.1 phosphotransferase [Chloroflexota bacterium]
MTGLSVPRDLHDVSPAWLTDALRAGGALGDASVTAFICEPINEGKGFISQVARLRLDYDDDSIDSPRSVLLKLPSTAPDLQMLADRLGHGRREVHFYKEVAGSGLLNAPLSYHCDVDDSTGCTVLLLEWLIDARQGDSVAGCTREEAYRSIVRMARFHAHWWNSPLLDSLGWMPRKDDEADTYRELYAEAWSLFLALAGDFMPDGIRRIGDRLAEDLPRIKAMLSRPPRTVIHGDFRLDNCFFREEDGSIEPIVFDWEFCARGRGAYDVATFLSEALTPEQRRAEEMDLLQAYHDALLGGGATGYSFEECLRDYRLSMLEVLVFWIVTGGFCDFGGERATEYLRGSLAKFDAAISDLASVELLDVV